MHQEQAIKELLVGIYEGVEFMREGKDHMEIRGINNLSPAPVYPEFLLNRLTVGAVPVAAGIIMDLQMPTAQAAAGIAAQLSGLTAHNGVSSPALDIGLWGSGSRKITIRREEYLLYFKGMEKSLHFLVMHGCHPQSGQTGWASGRKRKLPGAHRWWWK